MKYVIETNIPFVPAKKGRPFSLPYNEMKVGDSVLVQKLREVNSAYSYAKKSGTKFATKKVDGGYRVWRLE